jgi:hypothetical protein
MEDGSACDAVLYLKGILVPVPKLHTMKVYKGVKVRSILTLALDSEWSG